MAKKSKKVGKVKKAAKSVSHTEKLPELLYIRSSHDTGDSGDKESPWPITEQKIDACWADGKPIAIYKRIGYATATQTISVIEKK